MNITGYRFESKGSSQSGGTADIGVELIVVSQTGAITTLTSIEDISVDGDAGTNSTGVITDTERGTRNYTMPTGADLWAQNSMFVFKQSDFDTYFTNDENVVNGSSSGGIIVKLTSSGFGGNSGPQYATITIYYNEIA